MKFPSRAILAPVVTSALSLITLASPAPATLPLCRQVEAQWCNPHNSNCYGEVEWVDLTCNQGTRQYQCRFYCWNGQQYVWVEDGPYSYCCCNECDPDAGCDCLVGGSLVTMADGSEKWVEEIEVGDFVRAFDPEAGRAVESMVVGVHDPYEADHYLMINGYLRLTETHPVLSHGEWVPAGDLRVGDTLTDSQGMDVAVELIKLRVEQVLVYNFQVEVGTYVANGVVVHNKEDCELYEQHCSSCSGY